MSIHLITGKSGSNHVTANNDRYRNAMAFGDGLIVWNYLNKLSASVSSNNLVKIDTGIGFCDGAQFEITATEDVTIENGETGYYRNDLICLRYTIDESTGVESMSLVVVKGTPSATAATNPSYNEGSILNGDTIVDFPIYQICLNGLNIVDSKAVAMFDVTDFAPHITASEREKWNNKQDASTAINKSNIGSQSVSYAESAGSVAWSNVTGKQSTYPPTSHNHDDRYYTESEVNSLLSSKQDASTAITTGNIGSQSVNNATYVGGKFHVDGTYMRGSAGTTYASQSDGYNLYLRGANIVTESASNCMHIKDFNGNYTGMTAASYATPSSKLIKENIAEISDDEAKKILELTPVTFDYIEKLGGTKGNVGLIAEDTAKIIPQCVKIPDGYDEKATKKQIASDDADGIYNLLSIDYSKLIPHLIKMVQVLQNEIDELKADEEKTE